jgi:hypothetical protein
LCRVRHWAKISPLTEGGKDVASSVYSRTLQKAAELIGSRQKLARHLRVPLAELEKWIAGTAVPPTGTFLKAVDVVIVETQAPDGEPSGGGLSDPGDPPAPREGAAVRQSC